MKKVLCIDNREFKPIGFNVDGIDYVTSIAKPQIGDLVIANSDYARVYTYDKQRAKSISLIDYTKVIKLNIDVSEIPPIPEHSQIIQQMGNLQQLYYPLTKKQSQEVCEDIRRTPKVLPNDKCPCGSNLKYKKCCKLKERK